MPSVFRSRRRPLSAVSAALLLVLGGAALPATAQSLTEAALAAPAQPSLSAAPTQVAHQAATLGALQAAQAPGTLSPSPAAPAAVPSIAPALTPAITPTLAPTAGPATGPNPLSPSGPLSAGPIPSGPVPPAHAVSTTTPTPPTTAPGTTTPGTIAPGLPPMSSDVQTLLAAPSNADETTLLRAAARGQARLSIMDLAKQIQKDQLDMESDRLKFAKELAKGTGPDSGEGANEKGAGSSSVPGAPGAAPKTVAAPVVFVPLVRSVFSFGSSYVAQISVAPGRSIPARVGTLLPNGDKVVAISDSGVTVQRGKRRVTLDPDDSLPVAPATAGAAPATGAVPAAPPAAAPSTATPAALIK